MLKKDILINKRDSRGGGPPKLPSSRGFGRTIKPNSLQTDLNSASIRSTPNLKEPSSIDEFFFLDLCPPVVDAPTPVALLAKTKTFITIAWSDKAPMFRQEIDDDERMVALAQVSALESIFESTDPANAFRFISESFSGTVRVRTEEDAIVGPNLEQLLKQLPGEKLLTCTYPL